MIGKITIEEYKIHCIIGHHPHERIQEQEIALDLEISFDISKAALSDHLADTINYEEIAELCRKLGQEKKYHLIETFAHEALSLLFETYDLLAAKIRVIKKGALPLARRVSIELEQKR